MNRKIKPMLAMAVLATGLLLITDGASAQQRGRKSGAGRSGDDQGRRQERLFEALELSETQQAEIAKIHTEGAAERLSLRKDLMRLRHELRGEMLQDEPKLSTVQSLNERIGKLRTQLHANRLKERLAVREHLTQEQRDKMLMMRERHPEGRGRGQGPAGQGRQGPRAGRRFGDCTGEGPQGRGPDGRGAHECRL